MFESGVVDIPLEVEGEFTLAGVAGPQARCPRDLQRLPGAVRAECGSRVWIPT